MERYRVTVDGLEHEVEVARDGADGLVRAVVAGRTWTVEPGPDATWLCRDEGGRQHRVSLSPARRATSAHADGRVFAVQGLTAAEAARASALAGDNAGRNGGGRVVSPMPGRVVRVLVAEGEQVTPDRALVIVEAMKMENEVHATASGTVARIAVVAGATVDAGALLIEIDLATTPP